MQGLGMALLCLLGFPPAWAQGIEGQQQLPELRAKAASRLLLFQDTPEYPVLAKVNFIQGRVFVQIVVSPEGKVASAHVLSGNPLLAAAVLNSVEMWRYRPYMGKDGPTSFGTKVEVNFQLRTQGMDLVPTQAETDFGRQVKPPEVLTRPAETSGANPSVRLHLLVSAEGRVMDWEVVKGIPSLFERAKKIVKRWSFRPARWGTLFVPWYLDVDVPVDNNPAQAGVGSQHGLLGPRTE
ncbi:MAG TPA: TonB family protein [Terriglobia bacterium]|nr:TonB family protein [Terriglobia bacterium]